MNEHTGIKVDSSNDCRKNFKTQENLKEHEDFSHKEDFLCDFCGKVLKKKSILSKHVSKMHGEDSTSPQRNKQQFMIEDLICKICCRVFAAKKHLVGHMKTHEKKGNSVRTSKTKND